MGGKCWFGVDSKSFEISKEMVEGKIVGLIEERGWGFPLGSDLAREALLGC